MLKLFRVNENKCDACEKCVQVCTKGVFEMTEVDGKITSYISHPENCDNCGKCFSACSNMGRPIEVRADDDSVFKKVKYIDEDKCEGCEKCVSVCPEKNFEIVEKKGRFVSKIKNPDLCVADGHCTFACEADCKAQVTEEEVLLS